MSQSYDLKTPHARRRIPLDPKPTWQTVERGLSVGYARTNVGPAWYARKIKPGTKKYTQERIGTPDDAGVVADDLLSYKEAVKKRFEWSEQKEAELVSTIVDNKRYTIADAMADYVKDLERRKRKPQTIATIRIKAHILPFLGHILLRKLKEYEVRNWRNFLAESAPRNRTSKGHKQAWRKVDLTDSEVVRKRQLSSNRILTDLKAALNFAYDQHLINNKSAWERIKPFPKVNKPKIVWMTVDEARALVQHCEPHFALLVQAALYTGARYGELGKATVGDFDAANDCIFFGETKEDKHKYVHLNDEAVAFFTELTRDRSPEQLIFTRSNGMRWKKSDQIRPMLDARNAAGIKKAVTQHILRHTYASLSLMGGMSLETLSEQLGHASTEITRKHYAHLADSFKRQQAKDYAPKFGFGAPAGPSDKVIPIRRVANAS